MDPHAVMVRFRAARAVAAFAAAQRALRTAVTTPTSHTEHRAGFLTVPTPRARDHPRCVTLGADELHAILRVTTPHHVTQAERRKHLVVQEALCLAATRLGEITTTPSPATLAAARLAARELKKWLAKHDRGAAKPQPSIITVLGHKEGRSQSVLTPASAGNPKPPARKSPNQGWRNRTPEQQAEALRVELKFARFYLAQAQDADREALARKVARLEARHIAALSALATQEQPAHGQEPIANRAETGAEIHPFQQPQQAAGDQQQHRQGAAAEQARPAPPRTRRA